MLSDTDQKLSYELSNALFISKDLADQVILSGIPGLNREQVLEFVEKNKEVTEAVQELGKERTSLQQLIRSYDFDEV